MPDSTQKDVRWKQRFQNFNKALDQLACVVALAKQRPLSELEQQGLIQAFEFTHELAWNTLKDFLESRGAANLFGSKDASRAAFAAGLIGNGEVWMQMVQSRNQTTHTYEQRTANTIAEAVIFQYLAEFEKMREKFKTLESEGT